MSDSEKRLRYYNGQFLQEQDFTAEQQYHLSQQRRHNRQFHSYGIAEGLTVTAAVGATSAVVSPGTAIDSDGRSVVLTESRTLPIGSLTGSVLVVIAYKEQASDPATVGDVGNTRWWEVPDVTVVAENSAPSDDTGIRLARLQIATNGTISQLDLSIRTSTGKLGPGTLKAQNLLGTSAQFVQDQNGSQSPLAIGTGKNVGIGTNAPGYVLSVAGNIPTAPLAEVRNQDNEASIRYLNSDQVPWHVGTGGQAGPGNFFFWNGQRFVVATISPDGTVTANGLRLSRQGVAPNLCPVLTSGAPGQADVAGNLSVAGNVLVTGTVDGRDISADGTKLDTLASATIKGISNPSGNVDFVGQSGVTVTGNNTTKTITIAGAAGNLATPNPLGASNQFVRDQNGNQSPLAIGTGKNVGIGTSAPGYVLSVAGNVSTAPLAEVRNQDNEASIRYLNSDQMAWHVGSGGQAGAKNFFFWNDQSHIVATITPDGTLTTNGLKMSGQGTIADVTGDVSVTGKILVTGTVDGRDVSADGTKLDALASATIKGISNPSGNVDFVGQTGVTVTGNNTTKTITIAGAAGNLATPNPLGASNQFVRDQNGNQSPLAIGTGKNVGIGTNAPGYVLSVAGNVPTAPLAEVRNQDNEASIRYLNSDQMAWHVGSGGQAGAKNFFFWNQTNGVVATIAPDGTMAMNGALKASTNNSGYALAIAGNSGSTPLVDIKNQGNEASIRYENSDGVPWQSGCGGGGGAQNFFFWNQPNGVVGRIAPDGTLTMNGALKANTSNTGYALALAGNSGSTPLVDIKNQGNEASIRYENSDGVPWQSGCGGGGGTGNFFFWNQPNGIVATITPDGTLNVKGNLVVGGGLSMRRAVVTGAFGQADLDGTIRTIEVGFRPKLISLEGRAHAWFGKAGAYFSYGGAIGGFCQVADDGRVLHVAGHGPCITRSPNIPYFGIYNEVAASNPDKAFGTVAFTDSTTTPNLHVHLEVLVDSTTSTGFRLKLFRTTNTGCIAPDVFGVDMIFAVTG